MMNALMQILTNIVQLSDHGSAWNNQWCKSEYLIFYGSSFFKYWLTFSFFPLRQDKKLISEDCKWRHKSVRTNPQNRHKNLNSLPQTWRTSAIMYIIRSNSIRLSCFFMAHLEVLFKSRISSKVYRYKVSAYIEVCFFSSEEGLLPSQSLTQN